MRFSLPKKPKKELTRREVLAQRRSTESQQSTSQAGAFRRSHTLASSEAKHETGPSERQLAWQLRARRRKLLWWLLGVAVGIGGIIFLLSQLTATMRVMGPAGTNPEYNQYIDVADEYFATRPLERLRFALDRTAIQDFFAEHAPEVQSVAFAAGEQFGQSTLQLSFRQPTIQWVSGGKRYFVDDMGVTFEKSYFDNPLISVEDRTGIPPELGQEVVNRRFLSFLGQAVSLFRDGGVTVSGIILPQDTIRQVEFSLKDKSYRVKMTVDREVAAQVDEALHAVVYIKTRGLRPSYVDVRVDQRVFYK